MVLGCPILALKSHGSILSQAGDRNEWRALLLGVADYRAAVAV
jgi:hypothetical protein